ncbi:hypothetical protein TSOC_014495, partial [Tetrabaena socialis]
MHGASRRLLAALLLAFTGGQLSVRAYPQYWYNDVSLSQIYGAKLDEQPVSCTQHPTVPPPLQPFFSPHSAIRNDTGITFAFSSSDGSSAGSLCPGSTYIVKVSFGTSKRLALLTADPSAVMFSSPSPTAGWYGNRERDLAGAGKCLA